MRVSRPGRTAQAHWPKVFLASNEVTTCRGGRQFFDKRAQATQTKPVGRRGEGLRTIESPARTPGGVRGTRARVRRGDFAFPAVFPPRTRLTLERASHNRCAIGAAYAILRSAMLTNLKRILHTQYIGAIINGLRCSSRPNHSGLNPRVHLWTLVTSARSFCARRFRIEAIFELDARVARNRSCRALSAHCGRTDLLAISRTASHIRETRRRWRQPRTID